MTELHLFEIKYSELDEPYVYAAENLGAAGLAYFTDVRNGFGGDEPVTISPVPDDRLIEFGERTKKGKKRIKKTAKKLANESKPGTCVLCDGHYC